MGGGHFYFATIDGPCAMHHHALFRYACWHRHTTEASLFQAASDLSRLREFEVEWKARTGGLNAHMMQKRRIIVWASDQYPILTPGMKEE